ncbi:MAG TPA: arsenosugar biosynthesis radical SAM (seleno)protein ArsS [Nitrospirota bacterium]|nr:arsenosugar biosynthesis radical SAM (seleno)protein ArsS [Nitrospirota bacterium]
MTTFEEKVGGEIRARSIETMQVNVGRVCNQSCAHCHLEASRSSTELMDWETMLLAVRAADLARPMLVDVTGGAPELNPYFRRLIGALRGRGHEVQVRTNLTALLEPGLEDLPVLLAASRVRLVGSMPCYLEENVRAQRGPGVYEKSVEAVRRLNALGYGTMPGLVLDLVYNPGGAFLPPDQGPLEEDYRRELLARSGISFTRLLTITNMPVGRFLKEARAREKETYMELLECSFNPETVEGLMCTAQVSVGWDGTLYDCDFNLALGLPVEGAHQHVRAFDLEALSRRRVVTGGHCFGCTAGRGSSCKGALVKRSHV